MLGVLYQPTGSTRVIGMRPPHNSDSRTRQCAKLGKETNACGAIRSNSSSTLSGAREIGRAPSELQSLMRISYAVFCLKKKKKTTGTKREILNDETNSKSDTT